MPQFLFLGFEILRGVLAGHDLARDAFNDLYSGAFEGMNFVGIVGKQAHTLDAKPFENLAGKREVTVIGFETKTLVGLDGVQAGILQLICLEFGHQPDAAAFLLFVNQDARAFLSDHREGQLKLLPAVAAERMENVAGQALRVNSHQRSRGLHIAHHKRYPFFHTGVAIISRVGTEAVNAELSPARRKLRGSDLLNVAGHKLIIAFERRGVIV